MALTTLETLLRAKKLDVTLTSAQPWSRDEREARLAPTGWPSVDAALGGGFPRGECSEIVGPASSGRTAVLCALLAAAGARGEVMALIDTLDRFDPVSAVAMDLDLSRLLWVRGTMLSPGHGAGHARSPARARHSASEPSREVVAFDSDGMQRGAPGMQPGMQPQMQPRMQPQLQPRVQPGIQREAASAVRTRGGTHGGGRDTGDLLARVVDRAIKSFGFVLQAGGFGVVVLDLADVPMRAVRRLPFTTWLRVQRLIEGRDTLGLVLAQEPVARSARGVTMRLGRREGASETTWTGTSDRARLFAGFALQPLVGSAHRIDRR